LKIGSGFYANNGKSTAEVIFSQTGFVNMVMRQGW